jgi:Glycoside Hydrolase Family 113
LNSKKNILKAFKRFIVWYLIAILIVAIFVLVIILTNDLGGESKFDVFLKILLSLSKNSPTYAFLCIPYLGFLLVRSLIRDFRKKRISGFLKGFGLKIILPTILVWGSLQAINQYRQSENFDYKWDFNVENKTTTIQNLFKHDNKQRGIHFFGSSKDTTSFETLKTNNVEWLTFVPFLPQENHNEPSLRRGFRTDDSTLTHERWRKLKKVTDTYGFKIMLKPHIWLSNTSNGIWRSDIKMKTQEEWNTWFTDYSAYILNYAALAEDINIDVLCIGTELHTSIIEQPKQWQTLIKKVRDVYSGKLTYAANWNSEVTDVLFWDDLDFIGIQAYFPIAKNNNPTLSELETGWTNHLEFLEALNKKYNKPILFTELGYKSTPDAGKTPWEWNTLGNRFYKKISKRTQALCYQAFFNTVWQQPWFEGAHIWEWQSRSNTGGNNSAFTIQDKPALNIVAKGFREIVN